MSQKRSRWVRLSPRRARLWVRRRVRAWLFNRRTVARMRHREHVLCLGDSHAEVMTKVKLPQASFSVHSLGGATASGILNPMSESESLKQFSERLRRAKPWQQVLLLLGEVDCGFLIWHRAKRHGLSLEEQLSFTLDSYTTFIERVIGEGFARVLVLSAPLPTISDSPERWGQIANLRAAVTATRAERTQLTLRFNEELRQRCERVGATFVDVTSEQLDPESGQISAHFLRENFRNHHLADEPYGELIARELARVW